MTRDLPCNDAYNGGPVVPTDQCDEDYYSEASVQERKERRSAKYGHLRAAAAERAEEAQRIAEANCRSKERPPDRRRPNWGADGDAEVITVAVDEVPRDGAMSAERGWIGDRQPSVEWRDSHYSRQADRINTQPDPLRG